MSAFGGIYLTSRGRNLQVKAQTGTPLKFTRMAMGDGLLNGSLPNELTALKNEKKSLPITKLKTQPDGKAVVGAIISNKGLASGFYFREIGLFAEDPVLGEILYCYANAGNTAEYIQAEGGTDIVEKIFDVITIVGSASNVSAVINNSLVFVTHEDAQGKADIAEQKAKEYTDIKIATHSSEMILRQLETTGFGVLSGIDVTASEIPDMNVQVPAGIVYMPDGKRVEFKDKTPIKAAAADPALPRKDIVYVSSDGTIQYLAGIASSSPSKPALPSGAVELSEIDVPAGINAITPTSIKDTRKMNGSAANEQKVQEIDNKIAGHLADVAHVRWLGIAGGTANALTANHSEITSYKDGLGVSFAVGADSTAAATLKINSLSAIPIKKANGNVVTNLKAGGVYTVRYSAGAFILQGEGGDDSFIKSIQTGYVNGLTTTSAIVDISPVDINKAIVLISQSGSTTSGPGMLTMGNLTSDSSLQVKRNSSSGYVNVSWQVIEFTQDVNIQRGITTMNNMLERIITISEIKTSKSVLFFTYQNNVTDVRGQTTGQILNANQIRFERYMQTGSGEIAWYVVEFP